MVMAMIARVAVALAWCGAWSACPAPERQFDQPEPPPIKAEPGARLWPVFIKGAQDRYEFEAELTMTTQGGEGVETSTLRQSGVMRLTTVSAPDDGPATVRAVLERIDIQWTPPGAAEPQVFAWVEGDANPRGEDDPAWLLAWRERVDRTVECVVSTRGAVSAVAGLNDLAPAAPEESRSSAFRALGLLGPQSTRGFLEMVWRIDDKGTPRRAGDAWTITRPASGPWGLDWVTEYRAEHMTEGVMSITGAGVLRERPTLSLPDPSRPKATPRDQTSQSTLTWDTGRGRLITRQEHQRFTLVTTLDIPRSESDPSWTAQTTSERRVKVKRLD